MIRSDATINSTNRAVKSFEEVMESIKGLYEILRINFSENDIYFKLARDNIIALYNNILNLILKDNDLRLLKKKLLNSEIKADFPIDNFLNSKK